MCTAADRPRFVAFAKRSRKALGEEGEIQALRRIDEQSGFVVIDSCGCSSRQLFEIYQEFGLLCARGKVRRALLKTGDQDADAHYTLRDMLVTVAGIMGIPLRFSLAMVASSDPIEQVCRTMQQELRSRGCDARVFRAEREAEQWLRARKRSVRRSIGELAVL